MFPCGQCPPLLRSSPETGERRSCEVREDAGHFPPCNLQIMAVKPDYQRLRRGTEWDPNHTAKHQRNLEECLTQNECKYILARPHLYFNINFSIMQNTLMAQLPCWAAAGFQRGGIGKIFSPGEINRVLGPR